MNKTNNRKMLLLTSLVCLLPLIMSLAVYDELPDQVSSVLEQQKGDSSMENQCTIERLVHENDHVLQRILSLPRI